MIEDKTDIYYLKYCVLSECVYVDIFHIEPMYRGRGFSYKIFSKLQEKYNLPIMLECWPTLINFYRKLGFKTLAEEKNEPMFYSEDGYVEMIKTINN